MSSVLVYEIHGRRVTDAEKAILELLIEDPAYTYSVLAEKLGMRRKSVSAKIKSLKMIR